MDKIMTNNNDRHQFDNSGVAVREFSDRGRGLVACRDFADGELILKSPAKILNSVEYQMLRLMPAITGFLKKNPASNQEIAVAQLFRGLDAMLDNPDKVLGIDQAATASDSAIMYTFGWDLNDGNEEMTAAIIFGLASLCNHSSDKNLANAKVVQHTVRQELDLVATQPIKSGEEILLQYRSTPFDTTNSS